MGRVRKISPTLEEYYEYPTQRQQEEINDCSWYPKKLNQFFSNAFEKPHTNINKIHFGVITNFYDQVIALYQESIAGEKGSDALTRFNLAENSNSGQLFFLLLKGKE